MDGDDPRTLGEAELADRLHTLIEGLQGEAFYRPLRARLAEMGENHLDESAQFRFFLRAARQNEALARALSEGGFGELDSVVPGQLDPWMGKLTQAFNRMIEDHWEKGR